MEWTPASERGNERAAKFRSILEMQRVEAQRVRPTELVAEAHELNRQRAGADAAAAYDEALDIATRDPADDAAWKTTYDIDWGTA